MQTIFVVVRDIWPEGYEIQGICGSLEQASTILLNNIDEYGNLVIEEIPLNANIPDNKRVDDESILGAIAIYRPTKPELVKHKLV